MSQMKQLYDSAASPFEGVPAAQSTKPGLNLNAETFVPEHGYFPPPHGTPETWLEHLDAGMLSSDPKLPPLLVHSCSWTSNTLCDLAQLFCWEILAKANIVDFGPQAACFAREVYNTLAANHSDSEWLSSSFAFHLQQHAFKHFKSIWCSQVRGIAVPIDNTHHRTGKSECYFPRENTRQHTVECRVGLFLLRSRLVFIWSHQNINHAPLSGNSVARDG